MAQVSFTVNINVQNPPLSVSQNPLVLPDAVVGQSVSDSLASNVTGGQAPYSFSVLSGTVPAGLSLDASGNLTGTPTTAGPDSFQVTVTDSGQ